MASVAIRYARAFADVVIDLKLDPNKTCDELRSLLDVIHSSAALRNVWSSPAVSHEEKIHLLDAISQRADFDKPVRNFMAVILEHNRMTALDGIVRQFELELNQRLGFVEADITSSRELGPEEKQQLEAQIAKLTGRKVRPHYQQEKHLLGGAVVRVGSTIYDGSLRGQLERIRQQLAG